MVVVADLGMPNQSPCNCGAAIVVETGHKAQHVLLW